MASGSITLEQVAQRTAVLAVTCSRCERAGRYQLDTLIGQYGDQFPVPELLRRLSEDCTKRASTAAADQGGVNCPDLPGLFLAHPVGRTDYGL